MVSMNTRCMIVTLILFLAVAAPVAWNSPAQGAELKFDDVTKKVDPKDKELQGAIQKVLITANLKGYDTGLKMTGHSVNGDTEFAEATLFAGNEYMFTAVGGANSMSLDVEIIDQNGGVVDPKTGKILPPGTKTEPTDTVIVRPEWTGSFLIQVTLFCKSEYEGANWALISGYKVKK